MQAARLTCLAAAAVLSACSLISPTPEADEAFPRLPPESLGRTLERTQRLQLTAGEHRSAFQCAVRVTRDELVVIGLAPVGPRLFSLSYDGAELKTESLSADAPPPEQMLADLQMAYWPLHVLEVATSGTAWQVSEPRPGVRQVLRAGELYAEIRYASSEPWDGKLSLTNAARGYALDIDSRAP